MHHFASRLGRLFAVALIGAATSAEGAPTTDWLSGPPLEKRLAEPIDIGWTNAPLRSTLAGFSRNYHVAVLVDRRIDPERLIELTVRDMPLGEACQRVADSLHLGFTFIGPVGYFGPTETSERLRTLVALGKEEAQRLPEAARARWLKARAWRWEDLATPRELVEQVARETHAKVDNLEQIPHDLWSGADLPPISPIELLTLVTVQFDLAFDLTSTGDQITLVPLPAEVVVERTYPGGSTPAEKARQWAQLAPQSKISVAGGKLVVRGRVEDHELLARPAKSASVPASPAPPGVKVYTLTLKETPLDKLLEAIARQASVRLQFDQDAIAAAKIKLDQPVSVAVKQVTIEELLRSALEPAGLSCRRSGDTFEIFPAK